MTRVEIASAKVTIVFRQGGLPTIDPNDQAFVVVLGGVEIRSRVNAKAARKLAGRNGGRSALLTTHNALRADLVSRADDWKWSSLPDWGRGDPAGTGVVLAFPGTTA